MPTSIDPDRRAGVFGFGVEGRSTLAWLARRGAEAVVISGERPADLPEGTAWRSETAAGALNGIDVLIKSPGIGPSHPLLAEAGRRGLPVVSATRLFVDAAREAGVPVIGVTGSKGKSTTATLVHLALEAAGVDNALVGNIGAPALDVFEVALSRRPVVVFEMSSYQTDGLAIGPSVAVLTRLFPEHLDWHGSVEAYYASKLAIARTQKTDDVTIWNASDPELAARAPFGPARHVPYGAAGVVFEGGVFRRGDAVLFAEAGMKLRGRHNRINACAAYTAAEMFGARPEHMAVVLERFGGLPHRLEDLGVHGGARWINDSIATAPEAAVAAIESVGPELATFIGGGTDRGFDFGPLARKLLARGIPNVILLPPGAARVLAAIAAIDAEVARRVHLAEDLADAVALAARLTPRGATVLFSPASPSYGVFRNFEDRGDRFREMVSAL